MPGIVKKYTRRPVSYKPYKYVAGAAGAITGYTLGGARGAILGAKTMYNMAGGSSRSKKSVSYDGTTTQRDDKTSYRKKRMPRRKRKAWKKFVRKVVAVEIKDRGLQTQKFKYFSNRTVGTNAQAVIAAHLYGASDTTSLGPEEAGNRDLWWLAQAANIKPENYIKAVGGYTNPTIPDKFLLSDIRMQSAILDLVLRNNGNQTIIAEIYHVWYAKNCPFESFLHANNYIYTNKVATQKGGAAGIADDALVEIQQRNVSLFDLGDLTAGLNMQIRSVREVQLAAGGIHKMQIRDPKNYKLDMSQYTSQPSNNTYVDKKLTESYIVLLKNYGTESVNVSFYIDRTYKYTVEGIRTRQNGTEDFQ